MDLNRQKYADYFDAMRKAGATSNSLVQGLVGSGTGSMPVTATSNNPVGDLGSVYNAGVSANAAQKQGDAAMTNADTERQIAMMRLKFEPQKYFADIRKSMAEAFKSHKEGMMFSSMNEHYKELVKDLQLVRPWKIAGLRQGLINDMATYDKIVQETKTSKAQEGYYRAGAYELQTRGDYNVAMTGESYARTLNENLRGFRLQFENSLLSAGIDPSKGFWENTGRLMMTDPKLFKGSMDTFISALNILDGRLQDNLNSSFHGIDYKKGIATGIGLYYLNKIHQKNANARSYRGANAINSISKLIPFLNLGSGVPAAPINDDWFDWYSKF